MGIIKTVLAIVGLLTLLLIGSCVAGFGLLGSVLDPQSATAFTDRPEAEVRQAVQTYLRGATQGRFADRARVETLTDGTIRLNIGRATPLDLEMTVALIPADGRTKAEATYNADRLAWSQPDKVLSTNLHRCLRDDFKRMIAKFHNGQSGTQLDLDAVMARARRSSREMGCAA